MCDHGAPADATTTATAPATTTSTATASSAAARTGSSGTIGLWRLELLRLIRTPRLVGLSGLFLLLGLSAPVLTANMRWLMERSEDTRQFAAAVPDPTPAAGIGSYVGQVAQVGLIVLIISASGPLCPYGRGHAGLYYRMLVRGAGRGRRLESGALLLPRFVALSGCAVIAYLLGTVGAWYETAVLIGVPGVWQLLVGSALCCLFLVWVLAVVGLVGSVANGASVTAGLSVLIVILVDLAKRLPGVGTVFPSRLLDAPQAMVDGASLTSHLGAAAVAVATTVVLVVVAAAMLDRREM